MSGLAQRLAAATRALHAEAEQSDLMAALIRGDLPLPAYRELLLNLQQIYRALEDELTRHRAHPAVAPLRLDGLARGPSIASDLAALDDGGSTSRPLRPATLAYAEHLHRLGHEAPQLLAAHAYVRYLGDLHGGQILGRIVAERIGAPGAFYDFGPPAEVNLLKVRFRTGLDRLPLDEAAAVALLREAESAFQRHTDLFGALMPKRFEARA